MAFIFSVAACVCICYTFYFMCMYKWLSIYLFLFEFALHRVLYSTGIFVSSVTNETLLIHLLRTPYLCLSANKLIPTLWQCLFMSILTAYKWALSESQRLIKHKPHIKVSRGCVRQDRSEQRVFTVIKVNSGQPLGIVLLLRHVAAALPSQLYGLMPAVSNLPSPLFFKEKKRKHVKANSPAHSLLPPSHTAAPSPLPVSHP